MSARQITDNQSGDSTIRSNNNSRQPVQRRTSLVITIPDPDQMQPQLCAHVGATIQWRSETTNYPHFEIRFGGMDPCGGTGTCYAGSDIAPVVLRLEKEGDYTYEVWQYKTRGGRPKKQTHGVFQVRSCTVCQP